MVAVSLKKVFFKQKTAYEMLSGDWSSDVCSSDLATLSEEQHYELTSTPELLTLAAYVSKDGLVGHH